MPTKPWTYQGGDVEVDFVIHRKIPLSQSGPEELAYVEISDIRRDGVSLAFGRNLSWDKFIEEEFEAFQEEMLKERR